MRKTLILTTLSIAGLLAGPASPAAVPRTPCWRAALHSFHQVEAVVHNSSMIHALRASPVIKSQAVAILHGAIRVSHIVASLDMHISRDPHLITQPRVRAMLCTAAGAMRDYSRALRADVQAGERIEKHAHARRKDVALGAHGVGPSAGASRAPSAIMYTQSRTHDIEASHSVQHSQNNTRSRTRSQQYTQSADRAVEHVSSMSHSLEDRIDVSAGRSEIVTEHQTLLCPPAGCPTGPPAMQMHELQADGECLHGSCLSARSRSPVLAPPTREQARRVVEQTRAAARTARAHASGRQTRAQVRARLRAERARLKKQGH
jgi:hypothetical protein